MFKILRQIWDDCRPTLTWIIVVSLLGLIVAIPTALLNGLTWWQRLIVVFMFSILLVWASIATYKARKIDKIDTLPVTVGEADLVTIENIEDRLKEWIDHFALSNRRVPVPDTDGFHFVYSVSISSDIPLFTLLVTIIKKFENYLTFRTTVLF